MPAKKKPNAKPLTGAALIKEVCRPIRVARAYWDAHNNRACRGEREKAMALYETLSEAEREKVAASATDPAPIPVADKRRYWVILESRERLAVLRAPLHLGAPSWAPWSALGTRFPPGTVFPAPSLCRRARRVVGLRNTASALMKPRVWQAARASCALARLRAPVSQWPGRPWLTGWTGSTASSTGMTSVLRLGGGRASRALVAL